MPHLDLNGWLSLVSTIAVVVALVFAGLQLRQSNSQRRDQAAMEFIQSAQGDGWTEAMRRVLELPADASAEAVDAGESWLDKLRLLSKA